MPAPWCAALLSPSYRGASVVTVAATRSHRRRGASGARAARALAPELVRLETSDTVRPFREQMRIEDARRRTVRLFKSISCCGDLLAQQTDTYGRRLRRVFVTFTYRPDCEWSPKQITQFFKTAREHYRRRGAELRYVWVAEQHKSGRVHYHAILWVPKALGHLPKPDEAGWWPHGFTDIQEARKPVGYLIKYASKCGNIAAPWPKGCRLHGHGGLEAAQRIRRAWWVLPKYIREKCQDWMRVRRARGGGWASAVTGEWWPAWCRPFDTPVGAGVWK